MTHREAINKCVEIYKAHAIMNGYQAPHSWWDVNKVVEVYGDEALKQVAGRYICVQAARKLKEVM